MKHLKLHESHSAPVTGVSIFWASAWLKHSSTHVLILIRTVFLSAIGVFLFTATGCQRGSDKANELVFEDALSRRVAVPESIERVVTLAPGVTEIVAAAGGLNRIVGVSTADNYPSVVSALPQFSALPVNYEAVAGLEPDVVFATTQVNNPRDVNVFETLNIPMVYLASGSVDDILQSIEAVGVILQTTVAATATVMAMRERIHQLRESTSPTQDKPKVLFLISSQALHSFGPESYVHELIELAGGISTTAKLEVRNPILSDEFVLSQNPDIIVGAFGSQFVVSDLLEHHPTWTRVSAVVNDRVYSVESDLVLRAGPRIVDAAEQMAGIFKKDYPFRPGADR